MENHAVTVEYATDLQAYQTERVVRLFNESSEFTFPCLIMTCPSLESYRVDVLNTILTYHPDNETHLRYSIYIDMADQFVRIGELANSRLRLLLDSVTFKDFQKVIYLDKNKKLEGSMLYAVCLAKAVE